MTASTLSEMKARILDKAIGDEEFRSQLVAAPRSVISAELGVSIPEGFAIQVHQDSAVTAHIVLPLPDHLTEEELAQVAGGVDVNWDTVNMS